METFWAVCLKEKRTTPHEKLLDYKGNPTGELQCKSCNRIRTEKDRSRIPDFNIRGIGILCDDGSRSRKFPILINE